MKSERVSMVRRTGNGERCKSKAETDSIPFESDAAVRASLREISFNTAVLVLIPSVKPSFRSLQPRVRRAISQSARRTPVQ